MKNLKSTNLQLIGFFVPKKPIICKIVDSVHSFDGPLVPMEEGVKQRIVNAVFFVSKRLLFADFLESFFMMLFCSVCVKNVCNFNPALVR